MQFDMPTPYAEIMFGALSVAWAWHPTFTDPAWFCHAEYDDAPQEAHRKPRRWLEQARQKLVNISELGTSYLPGGSRRAAGPANRFGTETPHGAPASTIRAPRRDLAGR